MRGERSSLDRSSEAPPGGLSSRRSFLAGAGVATLGASLLTDLPLASASGSRKSPTSGPSV